LGANIGLKTTWNEWASLCPASLYSAQLAPALLIILPYSCFAPGLLLPSSLAAFIIIIISTNFFGMASAAFYGSLYL